MQHLRRPFVGEARKFDALVFENPSDSAAIQTFPKLLIGHTISHFPFLEQTCGNQIPMFEQVLANGGRNKPFNIANLIRVDYAQKAGVQRYAKSGRITKRYRSRHASRSVWSERRVST